MRICILKTSGKLLEAQSLATEGTLIRNALNAGYTFDQVEERVITDAEFEAMLDSSPDVIAKEALEAQRLQDIIAAFPNWATVKAKFDQADAALAAATTLAQVKPIVQGMLDAMRLQAKADCWFIKGTLI
jgi:hypothetical protein